MNPLSANLPDLYRNARCLKDSVYRRWLDTLSQFLYVADPSQRDEAARRIHYIETHLLKSV